MKILKSIFLLCLLCTLINSCKSSKNTNFSDDIYEPVIETHNKRNKLHDEISKWIGTPYRYGGHSKKGTDCSGFVMEIYKTVYNHKLERNSAAIMKKNCKRINKKELKEGDLIFFTTGRNKNKINHVGIYLKDSKFAHASSSKGVIISSLKENYYLKTYYCSGRVRF